MDSFGVVSGQAVRRILEGKEKHVVRLVKDAYHLHGEHRTINPPSYFLRFPGNSVDRIIALPSAVQTKPGVAAIKWISSFPGNIEHGIPRASAVLILNNLATGYPFACLESSIISASRTAASSALAAVGLTEARGSRPQRLGVVGTGLIARYVHRYLTAMGFLFAEVHIHDLSAERAEDFTYQVAASATTSAVCAHRTTEEVVKASDLVVFATTAGTPHVSEPDWFSHHPVVLHVSLRDLAPEVVLGGVNVVDDLDHCLRADTSVHLAEKLTGERSHVQATLYDVLTGAWTAPADRTVFFSPFGLGVLDLVVAHYVYEQAVDCQEITMIDDFFVAPR